MIRYRKTWLCASGVLLVLGLAALGWFSWPRYQQAQAEKALTAGDLVTAERVLRRLTLSDPSQVHLQLLHAQALRRLGRTSEAEAALARAAERGASRTDPDALREYALLEAGRDFARAEGALKRVLQARPDDTEVLQALADGYRRENRPDLAEGVYVQWLAVQPGRLEVLWGRGLVRVELGHFDRAAEDFRAVLRLRPEHFRARLLLAHCLLSQARMKEAEPELATCRSLRPDRPEPLVGLARCALDRDDRAGAQALVEEALALDPASTEALSVQGELYLRNRRPERALPVLEKLLRIDPRHKKAHLEVAQLLREKGDLDGAREHERIYQDLDRQEERRVLGSQGAP